MEIHLVSLFTDMADLVDHLGTAGLHLIANLWRNGCLRRGSAFAGFRHEGKIIEVNRAG